MEAIEIIDDTGRLWIVRECDGEDEGCTAIEMHTSPIADDSEPAQDIHIPPDIWAEIMKLGARSANAK